MTEFQYKIDVPSPDGETIEKVVLSFKPLTLIPIGVLRRNRGDAEGQMWDTLEWGLSQDQLEILDRVPADRLKEIMTAWQQDDGTDLGESEASSASSTSTVTRSRRTSSKMDSG